MKEIKMYQCSLCGKTDEKTFREARQGKLIVICQKCSDEIEGKQKTGWNEENRLGQLEK